MKSVALLRHAKSDWGDSNLDDIDRPLAERGILNAPAMGAWIAGNNNVELALVSPALRAQETFDYLGIKVPSETVADLYPTEAGGVMRLLREQDNGIDNILIIGHNPGISHAVYTLLNAYTDDPKLEEMPTCACAILEFSFASWAELDFGTGKLRAFNTPKRLED